MKKKIMNVNINYYFSNISSEKTIVLLHGWGQNIEMMKHIGNKYLNEFNVLIIDLPGFGESDEPPYSWSIYEYVECIKKLIDYLNIDKIFLIGHSFGGRISLIYASIYKVEKLVCLASPYCKEITKLPLKIRIYKKVKKIPRLSWLANIMKNLIGSSDYKNASDVMRGILVKSINVEMEEYIKKINCPTLLVWGTNDTAVPIKRAYELEKLIKDSAVIKYEGASHYAYLERLNNLIPVLDSFFNVRRH
ncbi:MAG: alpha/beta hydrolase [Bacilli bacterium]|nr:alpha/beta hydrolase [Bacilli bacterium]